MLSNRWGPRVPQEVPQGTAPDATDVELITDVAWADSNDRLATGELAPKPKSVYTDPCGCTTSDDGLPCCIDESCVLFACLEECPTDCTAGKACRNRRIAKKEWKKVEIIDAGPKGRGLRALEDIKKREFIIEYVGRAIRKAYLEKLFSRYKNERMLYIMALDTDVYIDARTQGGKARFINHSCEPNCVVERWKVNGILRAAIFAIKDIQEGEELSFDYKWERKRGRAPTKCHCCTPSCRGTLEMPKSMEEAEEERKLMSHWQKPIAKKAGREIVNRSIRLMSDEHHEWFSADVIKYDEESGNHLVMYRATLEEAWENLTKENWMILDEEAEQFVIAKKSARPKSLHPLSSLLDASGLDSDQGRVQGDVKNYLFVQTPIKDGFLKHGLFDRCQRTVGVVIEFERVTNMETEKQDLTEEDIKRNQSLSESKDGCVWKITASGKGHEAIGHALFILTKNVVFLHNKYNIELPTSVASNIPKKPTSELSEEVIIPRVIVDHIKKKMPLIRDLCRNVTVTFAPSESKSKQFAKLLIEANAESDLFTAKQQLWPQFVASCVETQAEFNSFGAHRDLGFFGGELSSEQFKLLVGLQRDFTLSQECNEDLGKSSFFRSFQNTQRCTVWVQAEDDMGRIDRHTLSVSEAIPNAPRKIYFGCDPKDVPKVWGLVETRAAELARGVRYLHLGADRMYQQFMMRKGSQFFNYIQRISGASVQIDSMTGDHLRIDGRASGHEVIQIGDWDSETTLGESEKAGLAEELIKLQIEIYRDHCTRHEGWIFGRDWALSNSAEKSPKVEAQSMLSPRASALSSRVSTPSSRTQFESRSVGVACMEIDDINSNMEMDGVVAAHAVVILYRFLHVLGENEGMGTNSKLRELLLASLFLANKSQKVTKWKRMESLLEAAYKSFYPGTRFDKENEEVAILENRVIQAENEILEILNFDIFWSGMDWVLRAAIEGGRIAEPLAKNTFDTALSGPVLAAGPEVWLTFGPAYIFAAVAGFLSLDLDPLFSALSLIPYKVSVVAEKIVESVNASSISKRASNISIFNAGNEGLIHSFERMKQECMNAMATRARPGVPHAHLSEVGARYMLIGQRDSRRLIFRGVSSDVVRNVVVPIIDGVSAESKCRIVVGENDNGGSEDIVLEGSWRALAIAEFLLKRASSEHSFPSPVDSFTAREDAIYKQQSKRQPGLLTMSAIHTSDGWDGTIQSKLHNDAAATGKKVGGKACVAGRIPEERLRSVGLRWWIPPRYGPSPTASICDMFCIRATEGGDEKSLKDLTALADLTKALLGEASASLDFPVLSSVASRGKDKIQADRCIAVSMQRWPSEKVSSKEQKKTSSKQSQLGYSPAALQEMQLLTQLHSLIPSPQGHPNFILPVAIALPQKNPNVATLDDDDGKSTFGQPQNDIFSLFQTSEQNERRKEKEKKRKEMATGPHLVFHPTPFVLQRVISRSKKHRDEPDSVIRSPLLAAWFHDLLSALVHCHTNHVVLRAFQADQVFLDDSGVAKLSGLYRATILPPNERATSINPLRNARSAKKEKGRDTQDDCDIASNPHVAPEILLGSMKHTKETDVWSVGCLMANLLLGKPLFIGKDRTAVLMAMFKIVGTPGKENYPDASRFPYYKEPPKKYKRGIEKAFQHMMKEEDYNEHEKAINLIAAMLHLDPRKRITAVDALKHEFMIQYVEDCATEAFRAQYVQDWISLKQRLAGLNQNEEPDSRQNELSDKRKAMILSTKSSPVGEEVDDLYDMDDILGGRAEKRTKISAGYRGIM